MGSSVWRRNAAALFAVLALTFPEGTASAETGTEPAKERSAAARGPEADEYDPFDGIQPSGRIPNVERPSDIKRPERWRYIPEGRLKPGNLFQRFLVSSFIAPFVSQDEDTGTGFGVAMARGWAATGMCCRATGATADRLTDRRGLANRRSSIRGLRRAGPPQAS